jgi:hypothetical protein
MKHYVKGPRGESTVETPDQAHYEDCTGFNAAGEGRSVLPLLFDGEAPEPRDDVVRTECYGRQHGEERQTSTDYYGAMHMLSACAYYMYDSPHEEVTLGQEFDLFWDFIASVHDICRGGIVTRQRMVLTRSGALGSDNRDLAESSPNMVKVGEGPRGQHQQMGHWGTTRGG